MTVLITAAADTNKTELNVEVDSATPELCNEIDLGASSGVVLGHFNLSTPSSPSLPLASCDTGNFTSSVDIGDVT